MAYNADEILYQISLYSDGRKPERGKTDMASYDGRLSLQRLLAWRKLDFRSLGISAWPVLLLTKKAARIIERIPGWVNWCVTLLFVNAAWILFRAGSFGVFREMCKVLLANDWGALHPELCRLTRSFIWAWIPGFPDWAGALLYLFLYGIIVFKSKNEIKKAQDF